MEERLKLEGSEREARRKRVEAIMLRTRGKGSPGSQNKVREFFITFINFSFVS